MTYCCLYALAFEELLFVIPVVMHLSMYCPTTYPPPRGQGGNLLMNFPLVGPALFVKSLLHPHVQSGDLTNTVYITTCMTLSNAPVWGLGFYDNPPMMPPVVPGRGVVRHYIDRCITIYVILNLQFL